MANNEAEALPSPGDVVAGKYAVVRAIGRGGMGIVIEAQHIRLNQRVALKLLLPSIREMTEITSRFEREARAVARLKGPHVTRILDVDALPDGSPFMVMELLTGRELSTELHERKKIPYREAVGFILQTCAAMAEAHRMGIVHRDLKPSNLFLCDGDGPRTVKVLDFGISKLTNDVNASMTTTAAAFGTPLYMSPEQVRSVKDVDPRADIWSLGVVLYELLCGEPPFNKDSATGILAAILTERPAPIAKRCPDVPQRLSDAVMRALEKDVDARYQDVREFAAAIAPFGPPRDEPTQAAIAAELQSFEPTSGRASRRAIAIAISAVVALGIAGAILALRSSSGSGSAVATPDPAVSALAAASSSPSSVPTVEPANVAPEASTASARPGGSAPAPALSAAPARPPAQPNTKTAPARPPPTSTADPKYL